MTDRCWHEIRVPCTLLRTKVEKYVRAAICDANRQRQYRWSRDTTLPRCISCEPGMLFTRQTLRRWLTDSPRANLAIALFCVVVVMIAWASRLDRVEVERSQTIADAMKQNANLAIAF